MSEQSLAEFLRSLGDTPDAVAESLRKLGIRGCLEDCNACPIAAALYSDGWRDVNVVESGIRASKDTNGFISVKHPDAPAVFDFVAMFDDRAYPDLIEE